MSFCDTDVSGIPTDDEELSLTLITSRLNSLRTTIQVNQFFPRCYFSQRFGSEKSFDPENAETYSTLKSFIKKYSFYGDEPSWAVHAAFEVDTFQSYDAPDFLKYLAVKMGQYDKGQQGETESSGSTGSGSSETGKASSETGNTSTASKETLKDSMASGNGTGDVSVKETKSGNGTFVTGPSCPSRVPGTSMNAMNETAVSTICTNFVHGTTASNVTATPPCKASANGKHIPLDNNNNKAGNTDKPAAAVVVVAEDHTSVKSSKSSTTKPKSKFKNAFSFGKKKKNGPNGPTSGFGIRDDANGNTANGLGNGKVSKAVNGQMVLRTEGLLAKHGDRTKR